MPFALPRMLAQGGCGQPQARSRFTSGCYGVLLRMLDCTHCVINNPWDTRLLKTITILQIHWSRNNCSLEFYALIFYPPNNNICGTEVNCQSVRKGFRLRLKWFWWGIIKKKITRKDQSRPESTACTLNFKAFAKSVFILNNRSFIIRTITKNDWTCWSDV